MISLPLPSSLNTAQLEAELAAEGVVAVATSAGATLQIGASESQRVTVENVVRLHVPNPEFGLTDDETQLQRLRAKAVAVKSGTDTFTNAQVQKIVAHLVLRATR